MIKQNQPNKANDLSNILSNPFYNNNTSYFLRKDIIMDNNKNRMKDRPKSKAERRKIRPKENEDLGFIEGHKTGTHSSRNEKS